MQVCAFACESVSVCTCLQVYVCVCVCERETESELVWGRSSCACAHMCVRVRGVYTSIRQLDSQCAEAGVSTGTKFSSPFPMTSSPVSLSSSQTNQPKAFPRPSSSQEATAFCDLDTVTSSLQARSSLRVYTEHIRLDSQIFKNLLGKWQNPFSSVIFRGC